MAWTTPKTWADGDIPDADDLNTHIKDNLNVVSTHAHSGAAGDGSADLSGLDTETFDNQGSTPAAPGSNKVKLFSESETLKIRAGASGAATAISLTNHTHTLAEIQTVEEEVNAPASPSSTTGSVAIGTSMGTVESATITVGGAGKNAIVITGVFTAGNHTGNSDGHTCRARLVWNSVEVLITSYSAQIDNNEICTFVLTHLEPDVAAGSKTGTIQAQRSGGTGDLYAWYQGLALLEAND
jgi:hypothetical protein